MHQFKHRMNTLAYGEAMMAAARDYGNVRSVPVPHPQLVHARMHGALDWCNWLAVAPLDRMAAHACAWFSLLYLTTRQQADLHAHVASCYRLRVMPSSVFVCTPALLCCMRISQTASTSQGCICNQHVAVHYAMDAQRGLL